MKKYTLTISFIALFILSFLYFEPIISHKIKIEKYENKISLLSEKAGIDTNKDLKEIPKLDRPDMAALRDYLSTADPNTDKVPIEKLIETHKYLKLRRSEKDLDWNIISSNMGGRVRTVMFDPNDESNKKAFAGSVTGGLWVNEDITSEDSPWEPVNDFLPTLSISSLQYDPNNTTTMYMGTGEVQTARIIYRESSGVGMGLFKSTDAGETWNALESTKDFKYITDIEIKDNNGKSEIYIAVASGTYHGEHNSKPNDGLYRSLDDGETWEQVLPQASTEARIDDYYSPSDIEITSNGRIIIGTDANYNNKNGGVILYSDNGNPDSWSVIREHEEFVSQQGYTPGRTLITSCQSNPDIIYTVVSGATYTDYYRYSGKVIAKSIDGGETWENMNLPFSGYAPLAWHALAIKVHPSNPDLVYTGGQILWLSQNSGEEWKDVSDWALMYFNTDSSKFVHADAHSFTLRPEDENTIVVATDGGLSISNNAWDRDPEFRNANKNMSNLQFYTCTSSKTDDEDTFIGGLQDNGTLYTVNNVPFEYESMISGGDGAFCFIDEDDPSIAITSVYYNSYYLYRNQERVGRINNQSGTFIPAADYDSKNNILYSNAISFDGKNAGKVLRIKNVPEITNEIDASVINIAEDIDLNSSYFSSIIVSDYSENDKTTLFAGTSNGMILKIDEAQDLPVTEEIGSVDLPVAYISSIAEGGSQDTLLATFSNYGIESVWLTVDGGVNWRNIESNLPDIPVRWGIFHPENSRQVLLATELGIWSCSNIFEEEPVWVQKNNNLANIRVDMLHIRKADNLVTAATHGRNLAYSTYHLQTPTKVNKDKKELIITLGPNPCNNQLMVQLKNEHKFNQISIININGLQVYNSKLNQSELNKTINTNSFPNGNYVLKLSGDKCMRTQKFTVSH
ncbi:MAG: T9SS type A sorting domain-containing protein [Hyphomicrobiales bacterium]